MSTRFGIAFNLNSLTRLLREQMDIALIADTHCVVVRNGNSWLNLVVNDKVNNFILTNLVPDGRGNMHIDLVNELLTISEIQEEVDIDVYLEQLGMPWY